MPVHGNSRCLTSFSNDSLQKLKQLFFGETASCQNSLQKLFSNSKVTLHDEPINSEFFTYYATKSSTPSRKSNEAKQCDTQSKLVDFFKNCIFSNQLFNCNQDPETRNKACMCKPKKRYKTSLEPNGKGLYEENNDETTDLDNGDTKVEDLQVPEKDIPRRDSGPNSREPNQRDYVKTEPNGKQKKPIDYTNTSVETVNNNQTKSSSTPTSNDKSATVTLHLPVDFNQFGSQLDGNQLKVLLCCNRETCNCDVTTNKSNKKIKKKTKGLETDKQYEDEETVMEDDKLEPEGKPKEEKQKKSKFSCFKKMFNGKSKNKQNQTSDSNGSGADSKPEKTPAAKENFETCRICHKINPDSGISGDQADTLKLLIKMEARQNYRQINNIIKELNDQQDDIKMLRETYAKLIENFPNVFGRNHEKGDALSNTELQKNVKLLFEMYRELSVKINEIHQLSANIAKNNNNNNQLSNNRSTPIEKSQHNVTSYSKTATEKSATEQSLESNHRSRGDENARKSSTDKNIEILMKSGSGGSASNGSHFEDEMPEKLPKSEAMPAKKYNCPCEINWGLYISNSAK